MESFQKEMKGFATLPKDSKIIFLPGVWYVFNYFIQVGKLLLDRKCDIFRNDGP